MLSSTLIFRSRVGSHPPSSSPTSVVNFRNWKTSCMLLCITLLVTSNSPVPSLMSSFSQVFLKTSSPSTHLQPLLIGGMKTLASSIYLMYLHILILLSSIIVVQSLSQEHMISLAIAQVPLNPIGPPDLCLNVLPPNVYRWFLNITSVTILHTSAVIILFSFSVRVMIGNIHCS